MKCYIDKFKTKYNSDDICRELISFLSNSQITTIFEENLILRSKCNSFKKTDNKNIHREEVETGIIDLYKTNEKIKNSISTQWDKKIIKANQVINDLDVDKIKIIVDKEKDAKSLFQYATLLWNKNEEEFNSLGDRVYEIYLSKKNQGQCERGGNKMDSSILDISLGEILKLSKGENVEKQEQLAMDIKNNADEIKNISQQMKIVIEFNKEIKKLINGMSEQIITLTKEVNNKETNSKLSSIDNELKEIYGEMKEVKQANEKAEQANKKEFNTINFNIKGITNAIENQNKVVEKLEVANKELKGNLNNISRELSKLDITEINDNKKIEKVKINEEIGFEEALKESLEDNVNEQKNKGKKAEKSEPGIEKENNDFGELLDDLLKDM